MQDRSIRVEVGISISNPSARQASPIDSIRERVFRSIRYVQHELPTDVLRTRKDYQSISELATREWTGYGAPMDHVSALAKWTFLATVAPNVPRRIRAGAYSCLAVGWHAQAIEDPEHWDVDLLYRAGSSANEAASLGLVSPEVLKAGFSIQLQGFRRPEDNQSHGLGTNRFERLTELWEVVDVRMAEINEEEAKRDVKVFKAPLQYVCAAEDCGIQATKKSGLLRCGGKCPMQFKPAYCSKECQKIDWKRHKLCCKADATESSVLSLNTDNGPAGNNTQRSAIPEDVDTFEGRAPGHSIKAQMKDGGTVRFSSETLGPQTMRGLRKIVEGDNNRETRP